MPEIQRPDDHLLDGVVGQHFAAEHGDMVVGSPSIQYFFSVRTTSAFSPKSAIADITLCATGSITPGLGRTWMRRRCEAVGWDKLASVDAPAHQFVAISVGRRSPRLPGPTLRRLIQAPHPPPPPQRPVRRRVSASKFPCDAFGLAAVPVGLDQIAPRGRTSRSAASPSSAAAAGDRSAQQIGLAGGRINVNFPKHRGSSSPW